MSDKISWEVSPPSRLRLPVTCSGLILAICVVFFMLMLVARNFAISYLALIPAQLSSHPWTIITHMFLHADMNHLFWNMLFLYFFGIELESRVGESRFCQIYFLSGLAAAAGQMAVSGGAMLGASGALYGVLGCLAILAPEIRILFFFLIPLSIRSAVVLFALIDFFTMGSMDNIAHMAHLAGLLAGLIFGYMLKGRYSYY